MHHLYGKDTEKKKLTYKDGDLIDYTLMMLICAVVVYLSYGAMSIIGGIGILLSLLMICTFPFRHGYKLSAPVILKRPQELIYMVLYRISNFPPLVLVAIGFLLLENYLIYLTPEWPHHTELMHTIALWLFYGHFIIISLYRSVILVAHLKKKEQVHEILMQSAWKRFISKKQYFDLDIFHAYFTGLLTHIILIAPWYIVINNFKFSVLVLPLAIIINMVVYYQYLKVLTIALYREHWLGHNSEFEFLYLHGSHHDAIPCGLIGVSGNGFLEGFVRHSVAYTTAYFNPIFAFLAYTMDIYADIVAHQYIPGVYPGSVTPPTHHGVHHFMQLLPLSSGTNSEDRLPDLGFIKSADAPIKMPEALINSIQLDEQLSNYKQDNPRFRWYVELIRKYQGDDGKLD